MRLYDALEIEQALDALFEKNDGELSDVEFQLFVEAQTTEITKIENLCKLVRNLDVFADGCKAEERRLSEARKKVEYKVEKIKKFLNPFIIVKGGKFTAGTFQLSDRLSTSVDVYDEAVIPKKFTEKETIVKIVKKLIKEALDSGKKVPGAKLSTNHNTQIK
jgi:hypothetical protein